MGHKASSPGAESRSEFYRAALPPLPDPVERRCSACDEMGVLVAAPDRWVLEVHDDAWEFKYVLLLKQRHAIIQLDDLTGHRGPFSLRALFRAYVELKYRSHCNRQPDRIASFIVLTNGDFGSDVFGHCLLNVSNFGVALLGRHPPAAPRCFAFRYFPDDWQRAMDAEALEIEEFRHKLIIAVGRPETTTDGCRMRVDDGDYLYEEVFIADDDHYTEVPSDENEYDEVFVGDETDDQGPRNNSDSVDQTPNFYDSCDENANVDDDCQESENAYDEAENTREETENAYDECGQEFDLVGKILKAEDEPSCYVRCDGTGNIRDEGDAMTHRKPVPGRCERYTVVKPPVAPRRKKPEAPFLELSRHSFETLVLREDVASDAALRAAGDRLVACDAFLAGFRNAWTARDFQLLRVAQRRLGFETATRLWRELEAATPRDGLLSLMETQTSGLFRHAPNSALNAPDFFGDVDDFVDRLGDDHCVVVASEVEPLTCLKVAQALRDAERAVFDPRSLLDFGDWVDRKLASGAQVALLVFWHGDDRAALEDYVRSLPCKATHARQKIVLVCRKGEEPAATSGWRTIDDHGSVADLSPATRERFSASKIGFQGQETSVADFFGEVDEEREIPYGALLGRLVRDGRYAVGGDVPSVGVAERRYVQRNFRWNLGCFTKGCLASIPVSEVLVLQRRSSHPATIGVVRRGRLYAARNGSAAERKAELSLRKNVHWMEWNGSCFVARHVAENHIQDECDLITYNNKVVIVSGEAGSGKTVAVSHMLKELKSREPDAWIIRLNMADAVRTLVSKTSFGLEDVIDLLCGATELRDRLDGAILRSKMTAVVAFVDGFDEVSTAHEADALRMLTLLQRSTLRGLWVTTRPQWTRLLEGALVCGSFAILPFTERDLNALLASHRGRTDGDDFVARVAGALEAPRLRVAKGLLGAPLLATMMAEVAAKVDDAINVQTLYERFLEQRARKRLFGPENSTNRRYYARLALDATFPAEAATLLPRCDDSPRDDGIVATRGGRTFFRHHTFAEFFVADLFVERLRCGGGAAAAVVATLRGRYLDDNGDVLRLFLDHMLAGTSTLHWAALHGDLHKLVAVRRSGDAVDRALDALARTPLHLAAAYPGDGDAVAVLFAWMPSATIGQLDAVGLSPLGYAYASLGRPMDGYALLARAYDERKKPGEGDDTFDVALRATLPAAQQRRGSHETEALIELVRNRFSARLSDLRECLYCAHFRRWYAQHFREADECPCTIERFVESMLDFFKASLTTERRWGELLRAHNSLVDRVKSEGDRWRLSAVEFNSWLTRAVRIRDFGALFRLRRFFRDDGWG